MLIALCLNHSVLCKCTYVSHWLKCFLYFLVFVVMSVLICTFACRFKAGPGRRAGGAGPHIQPRNRLGHAQRQRDACNRRPGHMKTNTHFTLLSFSTHPTFPSTSVIIPLSFLPPLSPSTPSQRRGEKEGCREEKEGWTHCSASLSSFNFSSRRRTHPLFPFPPFFPTPHSPPASLLFLAISLRASICHCYIQDCLLHES